MPVWEQSDLSYLTSFQRKPSLGSQVFLEFPTSVLMRNKGSAWKGSPTECPKHCIIPSEVILYLETNGLMQELFSPQLRIQKHNSELRDLEKKKKKKISLSPRLICCCYCFHALCKASRCKWDWCHDITKDLMSFWCILNRECCVCSLLDL